MPSRRRRTVLLLARRRRDETYRSLSLSDHHDAADPDAVHGAQPAGRRPRRAGFPAPRATDLHDSRRTGSQRGRGLSGRSAARCAHPRQFRRGGTRAHDRRVPVVMVESGVLCRARIRQRMCVLRRHVDQKSDRAARVGSAAKLAGRVGIAGVVAAARTDHGARRCGCALVLPRLVVAAAEHRMSSFHPHLLDRRVGMARFAVWTVMGLLVASFFRTQILGHGKYQLQSETNRLRPIPLPAPRGIIYDRNGRVLAENVPGYTVSLLPAPEANLRSTLARIASIANIDSTEIERVIQRARRAPYQPALVLGDAPFAVVSALEERRVAIPGLLIQAEPKRIYPDTAVVAHLIGYVGEVTEV